MSMSCMLISIVSWFVNSWYVIWMLMEINFILFMGCFTFMKNYSFSESVMKYFLMQMFFSLSFLGCCILWFFNLGMILPVYPMVLLLGKLGVFPVHYWLFMILGKLEWMTFFILSTAMKLIPLMLIFYSLNLWNIEIFFIISALFGSILGFNNTSIQKLVGYSSMVYLSWMVLSMVLGIKMFILMFFFYSTLLLFMSFMFNTHKSYSINQVMMMNYSFINYCGILCLMFAMCGFPPFLLLLIKWMIFKSLIWINMKFFMLILLMSSVMIMILYFNLWFFCLCFNNMTCKWTFKFSIVNSMFYIFAVSLWSFFFFL
uniref:NADH-ubiquinone oxidoreductase chain 2 n=1 Tax=Neomaskellia andropogonis TaxID=266944 RepID=Q697F4_NEOAD|nr:NADH dehydrogenase subunit 2 [Neomaskellia andropogonis]